MVGLGLLLAAALLLAWGADLYTDNVRPLAARLSVTALAVGLLIAGAEPEELVTAVIATLRMRPGIAAGDAVGANVTMLTLVLGILMILAPVAATPRLRTYAAGACVATTLAALCLLDGTVSRVDGAVLTAAFVAWVATVIVREHRVQARRERISRTARGPGTPAARPRPVDRDRWARIGRRALIGGAGLALVTLGGRVAVEGAERVADGLGVGDSAVGLTLVALATSAELFALMWAARRHRVGELALAALVGSVVGNATATLGIAALVRPLTTDGVGSMAWLAAALAALLVAEPLWRPHRRLVGVLLVATYVVYVAVAL